MESSPLNKAHQLDRRAEALLKQKKFDDCIECHRNSIKHLHEASNLTDNPRSKESIQLQINYHQKQIDSLKIKKVQYEDIKRYRENAKNRAVNFVSCENGETLQNEIFKTMETHDSLIEVLMRRNADDSEDEEPQKLNISGKKREVNDSTLIEEFKGLSEKLRELVHTLIVQVEERDNEIVKLKAEICKLQKKQGGSKTENTLRVITDSSGGTSPYVFSPCSELSPEVHDIRGLPTLAPLEMPNFDFSSLIKNANNLNLTGSTK